MTDQALIQILTDTVKLTLLVVAPLLATALLAGLLISIIQVVTSIQDMTLSFVPRIVATFVVGLFLLPWMVRQLIAFTARLFSEFSRFSN